MHTHTRIYTYLHGLCLCYEHGGPNEWKGGILMHIHKCMNAYVHTHAHMYICMRTYRNIHTFTHTCIYTYLPGQFALVL